MEIYENLSNVNFTFIHPKLVLIKSLKEQSKHCKIRSGADWLGKHFLSYGQNLNLKQEGICENNVMQLAQVSKHQHLEGILLL